MLKSKYGNRLSQEVVLVIGGNTSQKKLVSCFQSDYFTSAIGFL